MKRVLAAVMRVTPPAATRGLGTVSRRAARAPGLLPTYLKDARGVSIFHPETEPEGVLQLSVAENHMVEDLLVDALTELQDFRGDLIYYQPTHGRADCREALAAHLTRTLCGGAYELDPEGLVIGAGCNAVLENLMFAVGEPGEGVLIPRPYYAAFEFDLCARANMVVLPVSLGDDGVAPEDQHGYLSAEIYYPTPDKLEDAYQRALDNGITPRVVLLSSPNNPLGFCYPEDVLMSIFDWCQSKPGLHLVSDEIYGGSVFAEAHVPGARDEHPEWTGIGQVAAKATRLSSGALGNRCHIVWSLSKDFALSGLRVGALYTENEDIRLPLQKMNDLCSVSSSTQNLVSEMLKEGNDEASWVRRFEAESQRRVHERYVLLQEVLEEAGIPYLPSGAGLFVWLDLRAWMEYGDEGHAHMTGSSMVDPSLMESIAAAAPGAGEFMARGGASQGGEQIVGVPSTAFNMADAEAERRLYLKLVHEYGLLLTPGASMRTETPGLFRCVFTATDDAGFEEALKRFARFGASEKPSLA
mmetsp:Transcript_37945/g.119024  ORF Transcript_37945/g.119024 Transcript_37945/m.119024 type:complete len:528 (-) Transcript_37945:194-1777(-)|eukprot:CAMPEP_0118852556 /NCGR_PEP_ID=MMETSP1163-20130328/1488_1 /TAXON_ID=124430 /ORGANISM="Phaeomonas parva, Strain CCMP2877" /LENGTH=527 /DNA_ID=CAMNT_0006784995 /DNA_START=273 /DNA_END=1856 /DNA_ORIENTATION=+